MERPYQHVARHRYDAAGILPTLSPLRSLFLPPPPPALLAAALEETSPSVSLSMNVAVRPVCLGSACLSSPDCIKKKCALISNIKR